MKNILGFLIIVGLLAVAFVNRERLAAVFGRSPTVAEVPPEPEPVPVTPEPEPPKPPAPTPHPALEAQQKAKQLYPGITIPNSALNKKFVSLYNETQQNNPALLAQADWPLQLAERAVVAMGGQPLARTTPAPLTPKPLPGTPGMDRPAGKK